MGFLSLSHLGVVGLVIAIMAVAWKVQQRRPPGGASGQFAKAPSQSASWAALKGMVLVALFSGAMTPVFRTDGFVPVIHAASTIGLAVLAALWLFRKNRK